MRTVRTLGFAGVMLAVIAIMAIPALGHDGGVFHGDDYARTYNVHGYIGACDQERDGNAVKAQWRNSAGTIIGETGWDGTSDPECDIRELPSSAVGYRVCENTVGCSVWVLK